LAVSTTEVHRFHQLRAANDIRERRTSIVIPTEDGGDLLDGRALGMHIRALMVLFM
jgi:hypothetical protein